jgi:hypothetical protein
MKTSIKQNINFIYMSRSDVSRPRKYISLPGSKIQKLKFPVYIKSNIKLSDFRERMEQHIVINFNLRTRQFRLAKRFCNF